ncbi:hypothetical protein PR202_gb07722 [Eleusine coracana subsp. coracana]|uniref:Retrotransposon gag domain-containing protein n=1 Tax=Eleusine coracana subsp. coracana TaxID=191504 RepID=A0AAV5ECU4_ELECO|nr:hypothetical protein PR202_gb07722 [Eleusine coracana subsp. coracana]
MNIPGVHKDTLRWKLFPFSLKDAAKTWYIRHVEDAEGSWPFLREFFCKKFCLLSKIIELRRKLINFDQKDQELLGAAWERLLSYTTIGLDLGLPECMLLQHFVWGLKPESAKFLDIATGGGFVYTTSVEGKRILAKILRNLEDYQPTPSEDHSENAHLADLSPVISTLDPPIIEEVDCSPTFNTLDPNLFRHESSFSLQEAEVEPLPLPKIWEDDDDLSDIGNVRTMPVERRMDFTLVEPE